MSQHPGSTGHGRLIVPGDGNAVLNCLLHIDIEPVPHTVGNKPFGHEEKQDSGNKGKPGKDQYQFSPEVIAKNLSSAFVEQFDDVPGQKKDEYRDQKNIDIDQKKNKEIPAPGDGGLKIPVPATKKKSQPYEKDKKDDGGQP